MDGKAHDQSYFNLLTESSSSSGHSSDDGVINPSSDEGQFLPQRPFLDESYHSGSYSSVSSTPVRGVVGGVRTTHPDFRTGIHEEGGPIIHPNWETSSLPNQSARPPLLDPANVHMTHGWHWEGTTTDVPSVQGIQHTGTSRATEFSPPSVIPTLSSVPNIAQYREQGASQHATPELQTTGRRAAIVPSGSSRASASSGTSRSPSGRYSCVCGKSYSQSQGLRRHQREAHEASLCMYCGAFAWGRPYRLKEHLEEQHPDVDIGAALAEATRTRRRTPSTTSHHGDQVIFAST